MRSPENGAPWAAPKGHFRNNRMLWFGVFLSILIACLCAAAPLLLLRFYVSFAGP